MFNLSIGTCYTFWYMFFFHLFFPPGYIPFPSLLGHPPVDSQCLLAALLFLPPQMLWQPFALVPCPCCPVVQLCPWPLQPAMPSICEHVQYSQKICLMVPKDLSIGKPGRKKAELGSPGPTLSGFGGTIGVPSWEVTPRRNILQFLMGMKTNCILQLNSGFCFQASYVCYAGLQLLF